MGDPRSFDPYLDHGRLLETLSAPARHVIDAIIVSRSEWTDLYLETVETRTEALPQLGDLSFEVIWEVHLVLVCDLTGDGVPLLRLIGRGPSLSAAVVDLGQIIEDRLLQAARRSLAAELENASFEQHDRAN